jgi:putrescine transport system ATP-binding protein
VAVAVRPEKMRPCDPDAGGDGVNRVEGVVEDIAYLGDVSIYRVRVEAAPDAAGGEAARSQIVEMTLTNVQPRTEQALTWGQRVVMDWSATSGVVLTE